MIGTETQGCRSALTQRARLYVIRPIRIIELMDQIPPEYLRLDELLAKGDDKLTDEEGQEFASLSWLLADPCYQAYRRQLIDSANEVGHRPPTQ